jgi:hypothetical protein
MAGDADAPVAFAIGKATRMPHVPDLEDINSNLDCSLTTGHWSVHSKNKEQVRIEYCSNRLLGDLSTRWTPGLQT